MIEIEGYSSEISVGGEQLILTIVHDVGARRRAERELKESEKKFREIVELTNDWVWEMDENAAYTKVSPKVTDFLGYTPEEVLGKTPFDLMPPEEARRVAETARPVLAARRPFTFLENTNRHKDGHEVILETSGLPIFDEQGRFKGYRGVDRNITERKKAEREIEHLRKQIEFIVGATKTGLDIIDSDFNIRYIDPAWQKVYGNPTGRKCYEYFMGRTEVCPGCGIPKALESKAVAVTEEVMVKEGGRPIQVTTIPFQDERGEWLVAEVNVDITERKRAEAALQKAHAELERRVLERTADLSKANLRLQAEIAERRLAEAALRESEEKYRTLVRQLPDGVCIYQDQRIVYANEALARILGVRSASEIVGADALKFVAPEAREEIRRRAERRMRGRAAIERYESRGIRLDGSAFEAEVVSRRTMFAGRPAVQTVLRDITERKRAEEALRESEERYRLLIENAGSPIYTVDKGGVFLVMNNTAAGYLGGSPRQFVGKTMWQLFPKDVADLQMRRIRAVIRTGKGLTEVNKTVLQGQEMWFSTNIQPFSTAKGAATFAQVITHDITDRVRAEKDQALLLDSINLLLERHDIRGAIEKLLGHCIAVSGSQCGFFNFYDSSTDSFYGEPVILVSKGSKCTVSPDLPFLNRGLRRKAVIERKAVTCGDFQNDRRHSPLPEGHIPIRNLLLLPVCVHRRVIGLMGLGNSEGRYAEKDAERLRAFLNQAALAVEHIRMQAERERLQKALEDLTGKLMNAQEEERRRLSRDLHDGLGQVLTAIVLALQSAKAVASVKSRTGSLDQANTLAIQALDTIHTMSQALRPTVLDDFGLVTALRWQAKEFSRLTKVPVSLRLPSQSRLRLDPRTETALFRIAQESLNNVAKHAQATRARLHLRRDRRSVHMLIADNGQGFSSERARRDAKSPTIGLRSIQERVKLLGGDVKLVSEVGGGTKISVTIPVAGLPESWGRG